MPDAATARPSDDDTPEDILGIETLWRTTLTIIRHPLAFSLYRATDAVKQARSYAVQATVIFFGIGPLLGWLSHNVDDDGRKAGLHTSGDDRLASVGGYYDPEDMGLGKESSILLLVIGMYMASFVMHAFMKRLGNSDTPRRYAISLMLYLNGFFVLGLSVMEILIFGFVRLADADALRNDWFVNASAVLGVILLVGFIAICAVTTYEWPRRAYAVRGRVYYPLVILFLGMAQGTAVLMTNLLDSD